MFETGFNLGAVPGGGLDDLAATPEEEQRIEEQVRSRLFSIVLD